MPCWHFVSGFYAFCTQTSGDKKARNGMASCAPLILPWPCFQEKWPLLLALIFFLTPSFLIVSHRQEQRAPRPCFIAFGHCGLALSCFSPGPLSTDPSAMAPMVQECMSIPG